MKRFFFDKKKTREKAKRLVIIVYFGLLRRLPEKSTLKILSDKIVYGLTTGDLIESILRSAEFKRQLSQEQSVIFQNLINDASETENKTGFKFIGSADDARDIRNIIYFCPTPSSPIGGVKVILRHCDAINSLDKNIKSEVYFPNTPNINSHWLNHNTLIKINPYFNINHDLIILPECWALSYGLELINTGINYAIFVQNGYYIFDEVMPGDNQELKKLEEIYQKSAFILVISNDTEKCIKEAFKISDKKIKHIRPSVNTTLFNYQNTLKENIITYMPRKLRQHSDYIVNLLTLKLKNNWKIIPIDNLSETEVASLLRASKIFLSFSDREGFSLPPLEAAICGNRVIGYTGQGAKSYWDCSLFKEIEPGNLIDFFRSIEEETTNLLEKDFHQKYEGIKISELNKLTSDYSQENELKFLSQILQEIKDIK